MKIKAELWIVPVVTVSLCVMYRLLHFFESVGFLMIRVQPIDWSGIAFRAFVSGLLFGACAVLCRRIEAKRAPIHKGLAFATLAVGTTGFVSAYHLLLADVMGWSELLVRAGVSSLLFGAYGLLHFHLNTAKGLSTARSVVSTLLSYLVGVLGCISVFSTVFSLNMRTSLVLTVHYVVCCCIAATAFIIFCIWFVLAEKVSEMYE